MLCLFNISHFSSTVCSDTMAKRSQQDSGEERVTAKSRPMMNLIARTPLFVSSSTSSNPVKTWYGYQDPWKSVAVDDRSGRPDETSWRMVRKVRLDHEEILLDGTARSVRNGETLRDRSGRPDNINSQEVARHQNFVMGNEETELELSLES